VQKCVCWKDLVTLNAYQKLFLRLPRTAFMPGGPKMKACVVAWFEMTVMVMPHQAIA